MSERVEPRRSALPTGGVPSGVPSTEPRGSAAAIAPIAALPGSAGRGPPREGLHARFRAHYLGAVCFREDAALIDALAREAEPVLHALFLALSPRDPPRAMSEAYALTSLLARRAALLGATPSAALVLSAALAAALREGGGCMVDEAEARALAIVAVEGYCAARDERVAADLLAATARTQVAVLLGPRCLAVFLAGCHDERALAATLDRFGKRLLHEEVASLLLDLSRLLELDGDDDALARTVANFCASGVTLGTLVTLVGASPRMRVRLARWLPGAALHFADDYASGQAHALAGAGLILKARLRWPRSGWPRARGSPR